MTELKRYPDQENAQVLRWYEGGGIVGTVVSSDRFKEEIEYRITKNDEFRRRITVRGRRWCFEQRNDDKNIDMICKMVERYPEGGNIILAAG